MWLANTANRARLRLLFLRETHLPYQTIYHSDGSFIEVQYQGALTEIDIKEAMKTHFQFLKKLAWSRLLLDYREADIQLSTFKLYALAEAAAQFMMAASLNPLQLRRAIVVHNQVSDYSFFETVSVNRGMPFKVFCDREEAQQWLVSD